MWKSGITRTVVIAFMAPSACAPDKTFDTGPERPELEGYQADREFKGTHTEEVIYSGTQTEVTIEVVTVQSDPFVNALSLE